MTKTVNYVYQGTNGTIVSPVHLEDIYYTRRFIIKADDGKFLTKDGKKFVKEAFVNEDELEKWVEVTK